MIFDLNSNKVTYTCHRLINYIIIESLYLKQTLKDISSAFDVLYSHSNTKYANFVCKMVLIGQLKSIACCLI